MGAVPVWFPGSGGSRVGPRGVLSPVVGGDYYRTNGGPLVGNAQQACGQTRGAKVFANASPSVIILNGRSGGGYGRGDEKWFSGYSVMFT